MSVARERVLSNRKGEGVIVLDGRNDREKLNELLRAGEGTHLDYKETIDLTTNADKLKIVKDIVSLSNRPGGGYLVIGVDDQGSPVAAAGTFDRKGLDGANLGQLVRGYVDTQIHVNSQAFDLEGAREVVVVQISGHADGLPVPMSKIGQYESSAGRMVTVFREGEIILREGPANVPLAHRHWADLLAERERQTKAAAMEDSQALIAEVVRQFRDAGGVGRNSPPLTLGMSPESFAESVLAGFESGGSAHIRRFLEQARQIAISPVSDPEAAIEAEDRIAELASLAIVSGQDDECRIATDMLYEIYLHRVNIQAPAGSLAELLARAYAIGSLAIRLKRWSVVNHLVRKPIRLHSGSCVYASWLRHGQVEARRANIFPADNGGMLVSMARNLMATHPGLRPDVPDVAVVPAENLDHDDALLNSLCQFDLAYCLIVATEGEGKKAGYPTCAAFHQTRSAPLMEIIALDTNVRAELFPESSDEQIAQAMVDVTTRAERESWNYGSHWAGLPYAAELFAQTHGASPAGPWT
ncbi:hypothetical protein GCM10009810_12290 [Nostocoides vanveenii]|uniref:Schlafen AlbA-2 domain-containing protein n=1 Tax=Nostocoides vanveenii TaxID=330835 RepID=A0ABN2KFZ2_9MICO